MSKNTGHNRRQFLRGTGAILSLPFLLSAQPKSAWGRSESPHKRLMYYYVPNGFNMAEFIPSDTGINWTPPPMLSSLLPHKDDLMLLSGVNNAPGNRRDSDANAGAHFQQTPTLLTCSHVNDTPFYNGTSIDQIAAQSLGYVTPHRSINTSMSSGGSSGACGAGSWACAYLSSISWQNATTPVSNRSDPSGLFQHLFGRVVGVSETDFERRRLQQIKIVDAVREDAQSLQTQLSVYDRLKLDQYLTAVNEFENSILAQTWGLQCEPGAPIESSSVYTESIEQMLDVLVLAAQCDLSRVMTFMSASGGASHTIPYDWVEYNGTPITDTFHTISHHGDDPVKLGKIAAINQWEIEVFARFLDRLAQVEEVDGTRLLDNFIIFFSSEVSDGDSHSADNLPIIIAGGGQGTLQSGQHLSKEAPDNILADLHISLLEAMDIPLSEFGEDGTGTMNGILV